MWDVLTLVIQSFPIVVALIFFTANIGEKLCIGVDNFVIVSPNLVVVGVTLAVIGITFVVVFFFLIII